MFKASEVETGKINYNGSIYIPEYKITDEGFKLPTTNPAYINNAGIVASNAVDDDDLTNKETIGKNQVRLFTLNPNLYGRKI